MWRSETGKGRRPIKRALSSRVRGGQQELSLTGELGCQWRICISDFSLLKVLGGWSLLRAPSGAGVLLCCGQGRLGPPKTAKRPRAEMLAFGSQARVH